MATKTRTRARRPAPTSTPNRTGIPTTVLRPMERFFSTDFSSVRVFEGSPRAVEARALAFAQDDELHFAPGQFQPGKRAGQALLGHELAHVRQQRAGRVRTTAQRAGGEALNDDPVLEREAQEQGRDAAEAVAAAGSEPIDPDSSAGLGISDLVSGDGLGNPGSRGPLSGGQSGARRQPLQRAAEDADVDAQADEDEFVADFLIADAEREILEEADRVILNNARDDAALARIGNARANGQVASRKRKAGGDPVGIPVKKRPLQRKEVVTSVANAPGDTFDRNAATTQPRAAIGAKPAIAHGPLGPMGTSTSVTTTDLHRQPNGKRVGRTRPNNWPQFTAMLGGGRNPSSRGMR